VSLEWGLAGALAAPEESIGFVVVDVLSFTTAVTVAVSRGTEVVPCPDDQTARRVAVEIPGTAVAVRRSSVDPAHPWSLSPADLDRAPAAGRLALASPNGATVAAALAADGKLVVACSLRNVTAVANWLLGDGLSRCRQAGQAEWELTGSDAPGPRSATESAARRAHSMPPRAPRHLVVVAAGERWPDGSLRPALEDSICAGRLLQILRDGSLAARLSPAAVLAARSVAGLSRAETAGFVRGSVSAAELRIAGYEEDVEMAVGTDADSVVPVLRPDHPTTPAAGFRPAPGMAPAAPAPT